jgi:hypothetical protein
MLAEVRPSIVKQTQGSGKRAQLQSSLLYEGFVMCLVYDGLWQ